MIKELIERIGMFDEEILQTRLKMINLEHGLYNDMLALTELNFEIWKDIKGYVGIYQISNLGNVRNAKTLRILKPVINKKRGYNIVNLCHNGKIKTVTIHRLIALAFIPNPENKTCIDHKNNDKKDNKIINLRWCTTKENSMNALIGKRNTSTIKGVDFHKQNNKWRAQIMFNGKSIHLGYFQNIEDAKQARQTKAKELFGIYINKCEQ
jgi:hypothetical protein